MLTKVVLFTVLFSGATQECMTPSTTEVALRQRVERYYSLFSNRSYEQMWNMSSRELRRKNSNDKQEYVRFLQRVEKAQIKAQIKKVQISGDLARVTLDLHIKPSSDDSWLIEQQQDTWVYYNRSWYFDGSRTLESGEPEAESAE